MNCGRHCMMANMQSLIPVPDTQKTRKIVKVKTDGTEENLFNSKNNESSIWEKIPAGLSIVSWNGAFGFDIILFNERGTPRWTLH